MFKKRKLSSYIAMSAFYVPVVSAEGNIIEEVMVTATMRAQSVQEVPYNISAFSGEKMERQGITDMAQLSRNIPGIAFMDKGPRTAGAFANSIAMRGINVDSSGNSSERPGSTAPTVGTYVGNTPIFTSLRLKDIERVEVLRGPQGTLYGSGAMGGIVRLVQNKPNVEETQVKVSTRLSSTDHSDGLSNETDVLFNLPLNSNFAVRGNVGRVDNAGFIDSPNLYQVDRDGAPILADPSDPVNSSGVFHSETDINDEDIVNGRLSLLWDVSDKTSVTLSYHMQRDEVGGRQGDNEALAEYDSGTVSEEPFERDVDLYSLDVESDLGFATMTVAMAHTEVQGDMLQDSSGNYGVDGSLGFALNFPGYFGSGVDLYTEYYGNNPRYLVSSRRTWEDKIDSMEVRLVSNTDGAYDWLLGVNYLKQKSDFRQADSNLGRNDYVAAVNNAGAILIGLDGSPAVGPGFFTDTTPNDLVYFFDNKTEFTDKAVYGELTYHISEAWQVTGGFRYFDQKFEAIQEGGIVTGNFIGGAQASFNEKDTLFKFNTSYDLNDDTMLFFTWAEGFRRGGVNAVPESKIRPDRGEALIYVPDELTSMEVGIKGSFGKSWDYTATLFDVNWENAQLNTTLTALVLIGAANIPEAETQGFEIELTGNLTDSLSLSFGYAHVDSEVTKSVVQADRLAVVGSELPIPKQTASVALTYFQELTDAELIWNINASYRDETPSGTLATKGGNALRYTVYEAFTLVDASVVYNAGAWSVTGFVSNLTNERGTVGGSSAGIQGPDFAWESVVRPRTIGVGLTYEFSK